MSSLLSYEIIVIVMVYSNYCIIQYKIILKQILILLIFINASLLVQTSEFIKGADISFIPQIEDLGGKYYVDGVETNPVEIFCQSSFITYGCGFGILQQIVISELKRIT